jgi:hypothetical protein
MKKLIIQDLTPLVFEALLKRHVLPILIIVQTLEKYCLCRNAYKGAV